MDSIFIGPFPLNYSIILTTEDSLEYRLLSQEKTRSKLNSLWTGSVQKTSYDKVQAHAQECNHFTVNKQALVIPHEVAGLCPNPADKPSSVK